MKKNYAMPQTAIVAIECVTMQVSSPGVQSENGIGYGGVDTDGSVEPGARRGRNMWGDEDASDF